MIAQVTARRLDHLNLKARPRRNAAAASAIPGLLRQRRRVKEHNIFPPRPPAGARRTAEHPPGFHRVHKVTLSTGAARQDPGPFFVVMRCRWHFCFSANYSEHRGVAALSKPCSQSLRPNSKSTTETRTKIGSSDHRVIG